MSLKCPNCSSAMQEVQKLGVHLDYCPTCKGIWLDRGEIDKVLQSAGAQSANIDAPSHGRELWKVLSELRREGRFS